jgi:hypothetical protein
MYGFRWEGMIKIVHVITLQLPWNGHPLSTGPEFTKIFNPVRNDQQYLGTRTGTRLVLYNRKLMMSDILFHLDLRPPNPYAISWTLCHFRVVLDSSKLTPVKWQHYQALMRNIPFYLCIKMLNIFISYIKKYTSVQRQPVVKHHTLLIRQVGANYKIISNKINENQ